jgi:hypothetical protein
MSDDETPSPTNRPGETANEPTPEAVPQSRGEGASSGLPSFRDLPPARRLWLQFAQGIFYLAVVATILSGMSGQGFWRVLVAALLAALFTTAVLLAWSVRWALRDEGRPWQFSLGSLVLLTALAAAYFGAIRWLVVNSRPRPYVSPLAQFIEVGLVCFFLAMVSIPCLARMAESLVWLAAWLVRRRPVQRLLSRSRRV